MTRTLVAVLAFGVIGAVAAPSYAENEADVTYYKDVLPIMQENCQSCHRPSGQNISGLIAPMAFMSYEETRPWARSIAHKVQTREMPPWFADAPTGVFSNERGLTDAEIETIQNWVAAGAPAGSQADTPTAKVFAEQVNDGWTLGTPDFVVRLSDPYVVKDDINDINIVFYEQIGEDLMPEDTWVKGWEFRVGDNGWTHHMCSSVFSPSVAAELDGTAVESEGEGADSPDSRLLSCVAEGGEPDMLPEGFAVRVEKGSAVSFNLHYNKEPGAGTAFDSQPEIGFWVEKNPVKHEVINDSLYNRGFEIPPHHANYRVGSSRMLEKDTLVLTYWPHAHLRATAARYTAIYPDGNEEVLLNVPNYDQGWQVTYKYKEPKFLPKGTRLDVDFWYDNTPERAARMGFNADRFVGYGPRTEDEMSLGFIGYVEIDDTKAMKTTDND